MNVMKLMKLMVVAAGRLDQPAAGGRDRLSADRQKKGRWINFGERLGGLLRYYYRDDRDDRDAA